MLVADVAAKDCALFLWRWTATSTRASNSGALGLHLQDASLCLGQGRPPGLRYWLRKVTAMVLEADGRIAR